MGRCLDLLFATEKGRIDILEEEETVVVSHLVTSHSGSVVSQLNEWKI